MTHGTIPRRSFIGALAGSAGLVLPTFAAQRQVAQGENFTLAINEAATAAVPIPELVRRYEPLAKILALSSGHTVDPRPIIDIKMFLDELLRGPEFIFTKSVDILASQVVAMNYNPIVKISKPYVAGIILAKDSKAKTLSDLIGTDVMLPPAQTTTAKLAMAVFRDAGIGVVVKEQSDHWPTTVKNMITVRHVQYQEIIPANLAQNWWYQAGVVNPTMISKWKGKVLMLFKPQPNWSIAAQAGIPAATVRAAASALISMHKTPEGQAALEAMKIDNFVEATRAEYVDLANYIKT